MVTLSLHGKKEFEALEIDKELLVTGDLTVKVYVLVFMCVVHDNLFVYALYIKTINLFNLYYLFCNHAIINWI